MSDGYVEPEEMPPAAEGVDAAAEEGTPLPLDGELLPAGAPEVRWEGDAIRQHLQWFGAGLHELVGRGDRDWLMTKADLDRIGPPLERILNRYDTTRAVAAASDPIALAGGTMIYAVRSVLQSAAAQAEAREAAEAMAEGDRAGYVDYSGDAAPGAAEGAAEDPAARDARIKAWEARRAAADAERRAG